MRDLYSTKQFDKDLKQVFAASGANLIAVKKELALVIGRLLFDVPLEPHHRDHALTGNWATFRDCHVLNDLVLIYKRYDKANKHATYGENALLLARIGSHSALGM